MYSSQRMNIFLVLILTLYAKISEEKECPPCSSNYVKLCIEIPPPGKNNTGEIVKHMAYLNMAKCDYKRIVCEMGSQGTSVVSQKLCDEYYRLRRYRRAVPPMPRHLRALQLGYTPAVKSEDVKQ